MRIKKKIGARTKALDNPSEVPKIFMIFEGEETEYQYFKGIEENREQLKIRKLIQIEPIYRGFREKGWSNPKKILDRLLEFIGKRKDYTLNVDDMVTCVIDSLIDDGILKDSNLIPIRELHNEILDHLNGSHNLSKEAVVADIKETVQIVSNFLNEVKEMTFISDNIIRYIELQQNITYSKEIDVICLVVDRDRDSFTEEQYCYVVNECEKHGIELYVTNPNFEFWLILHYIGVQTLDKEMLLSNPLVTAKKRYTEAELKKQLTSYRKNNLEFSELIGRIDTAIENANELCGDSNDLKNEVGTNLHKLIIKLRQK